MQCSEAPGSMHPLSERAARWRSPFTANWPWQGLIESGFLLSLPPPCCPDGRGPLLLLRPPLLSCSLPHSIFHSPLLTDTSHQCAYCSWLKKLFSPVRSLPCPSCLSPVSAFLRLSLLSLFVTPSSAPTGWRYLTRCSDSRLHPLPLSLHASLCFLYVSSVLQSVFWRIETSAAHDRFLLTIWSDTRTAVSCPSQVKHLWGDKISEDGLEILMKLEVDQSYISHSTRTVWYTLKVPLWFLWFVRLVPKCELFLGRLRVVIFTAWNQTMVGPGGLRTGLFDSRPWRDCGIDVPVSGKCLVHAEQIPYQPALRSVMVCSCRNTSTYHWVPVMCCFSSISYRETTVTITPPLLSPPRRPLTGQFCLTVWGPWLRGRKTRGRKPSLQLRSALLQLRSALCFSP